MAFFGRSKNKIQNPYTLVDVYKYYENSIDKESPYDIGYTKFRKICEDFNIKISEYLINNAGEYKLYSALGILCITKLIPKDLSSRKLSIDYKASNEIGKQVYHLNEHSNGFKYMFYWDKKNSLVKNIKYYRFIPTRALKRGLAKAIKEERKDYFYLQKRKQNTNDLQAN